MHARRSHISNAFHDMHTNPKVQTQIGYKMADKMIPEKFVHASGTCYLKLPLLSSVRLLMVS
jgi:hypothetical protein